MPSPSPAVHTVKTYAVTPRPNPQAPRQLDLSPWEIIERLRNSVEEALFHFYPLSGRIRAVTCEGDGVTCHVEVGCEGEGAEFVHAVADGIEIADVVAADGQEPGPLQFQSCCLC